MPRLIARLLLVVLVLLSSGAMPVPTRAGKSRSCCSVKSSCERMRSEAGEKSCCRLPSPESHADPDELPSGACLLAATGCGPAAVTAPSAPVVFQFILPDGPEYRVADPAPLARIATDDTSIDAERELRPRPPRLARVPESRA